jgi:hypothetical protein
MKETIKGKTTNSSSQNETRRADRSSVTSDSAACSNTIGAPHAFDETVTGKTGFSQT